MRKGLAQGQSVTHFDSAALKKLEKNGYKYVQIKGLTVDKHFDYIEPHFMVLVPLKELPLDQDKKDIYEPILSEILQQWAIEKDEHFEVVIAS
jgi:predicted RNA binding protein YcfA (HicA-like mRNA interferase family)